MSTHREGGWFWETVDVDEKAGRRTIRLSREIDGAALSIYIVVEVGIYGRDGALDGEAAEQCKRIWRSTHPTVALT